MPKNDPPMSGSGLIDFTMLAGAVGYRLRRAQLAVHQHFIESFAEVGITPADLVVLTLIEGNPGLKQSEVAEALGIQRANFVAIIDGLERRGLAERRKSEKDRRVQFLFSTEAGRKFLKDLMPIWRRHEARQVERLGGPDARDQLIALLDRLYD